MDPIRREVGQATFNASRGVIGNSKFNDVDNRDSDQSEVESLDRCNEAVVLDSRSGADDSKHGSWI